MSAAAFVASAVSSDPRPARTLLAEDPPLARHDLACACAAGEPDEVARQEAAAGEPTGPYGWPPLLYACFSRLLRTDRRRAAGIREAARVPLEAGGLLRERGADDAAVTAEDRALGRDLADGGTPPDVPVATLDALLIPAIEGGHDATARLLLDAGARVDGDPERDEIPLGQACWRRWVEMVRELVDCGAALEFRDGGSALGALPAPRGRPDDGHCRGDPASALRRDRALPPALVRP